SGIRSADLRSCEIEARRAFSLISLRIWKPAEDRSQNGARLLLFENQYRERTRDYGPTPASRGHRPEIGRRYIEAMGRRIEAQVARALGCLDGLRDVVLVRRVLMNDGEASVGVRGERVRGGRIVACSVNSHADWNRGHYTSGLIIGNGHHA